MLALIQTPPKNISNTPIFQKLGLCDTVLTPESNKTIYQLNSAKKVLQKKDGNIMAPPISLQEPLLLFAMAIFTLIGVFSRFTEKDLNIDERILSKKVMEHKRYLDIYKHYHPWAKEALNHIKQKVNPSGSSQVIFSARLLDIVRYEFPKSPIKSNINTCFIYDKAIENREKISDKNMSNAMDKADAFHMAIKEHLTTNKQKEALW